MHEQREIIEMKPPTLPLGYLPEKIGGRDGAAETSILILTNDPQTDRRLWNR